MGLTSFRLRLLLPCDARSLCCAKVFLVAKRDTGEVFAMKVMRKVRACNTRPGWESLGLAFTPFADSPLLVPLPLFGTPLSWEIWATVCLSACLPLSLSLSLSLTHTRTKPP